ncbi:hypothetical protein [Terracidiphilus gabretensis]|uniref:hypothetical protein n=1 Tax=Terracidiphilus gabretensis TaxID=1577687 RepID=UPI0012F89FF7|nr:hypothetical protein [Terracidiphilus gabretensis]
MNKLEELRQSFRPERITTLFVGESAPNSGRFFYSGDSSLFRAMKKAFGNHESFLQDFQHRGFYLDDLVLTPVNKLQNSERSRLRKEAIPQFAKRLIDYRPTAIVIVMRGIQSVVRDAMRIASVMYEPFCVPHPAFGNSIRFHIAMTEIIESLPVTDGSKSKGLNR